MLKFDGCNIDLEDAPAGYKKMGKSLIETGRNILYICEWPDYDQNASYAEVALTCNQFRNYHDVDDSWDSVFDIINHYAANQVENRKRFFFLKNTPSPLCYSLFRKTRLQNHILSDALFLKMKIVKIIRLPQFFFNFEQKRELILCLSCFFLLSSCFSMSVSSYS